MSETTKTNEALEDFVKAYDEKATMFYQVAFYILLDKQIAEEVQKEAFFAGCKSLKYANKNNQNFWALLLMQIKRRFKDRNLSQDVPTVEPIEGVVGLEEALTMLSPKARTVIALYMVGKLEVKEIAKLLSMKKGQVEDCLTKNVVLLNKLLGITQEAGVENDGEI